MSRGPVRTANIGHTYRTGSTNGSGATVRNYHQSAKNCRLKARWTFC